jgi:hypothetical protein
MNPTPLRLTLAASLLTIGLYLLAVNRVPWMGLLSPRGGIVTLSLSLLLANGAVWFARQPERSMRRRFELITAAWIWLAVQAGCLIYFLSTA